MSNGYHTNGKTTSTNNGLHRKTIPIEGLRHFKSIQKALSITIYCDLCCIHIKKLDLARSLHYPATLLYKHREQSK